MFGGHDGEGCKSVALYSLVDKSTDKIFTLRNKCWDACVTRSNMEFIVMNHDKKEVVSLCDPYFSYVKKIGYAVDTATAHAVDDFVIVAGGVDPSGDKINPKYKMIQGERVRDFGGMLVPRFDHCGVLQDGRLYSIGGFNGTDRLYSCEVLDVRTQEVAEIAPLRNARSSAACIWVADHGIVVTGGYDTYGNALSSVEIYVPGERAWFSLPSMIRPRNGHSACVCNGKVYVLGGFHELTVECFDFDTYQWEMHGKLPTDRWGARAFAW